MAYEGAVRPTGAFAVTPNDTTDLPRVAEALWVGGAGNLSVIFERDVDPVSLVGVPAGSYVLGRIRRVRLSGTSATDIVAKG